MVDHRTTSNHFQMWQTKKTRPPPKTKKKQTKKNTNWRDPDPILTMMAVRELCHLEVQWQFSK